MMGIQDGFLKHIINSYNDTNELDFVRRLIIESFIKTKGYNIEKIKTQAVIDFAKYLIEKNNVTNATNKLEQVEETDESDDSDICSGDSDICSEHSHDSYESCESNYDSDKSIERLEYENLFSSDNIRSESSDYLSSDSDI